MKKTRPKRAEPHRPGLRPGIPLAVFRRTYWWKTELARFARALGLSAQGSKPELTRRIERSLRGLPPEAALVRRARPAGGGRDSDRPLRRTTPVRHYFSDARTRAFFVAEIGPGFHFTYHLNQYRLARAGLTYGDLVDEWLAERERRSSPDYSAPIAAHGKYNRFIRAYFADPRNRGRSLADAAAAWNRVKFRPGDPRYRRTRR